MIDCSENTVKDYQFWRVAQHWQSPLCGLLAHVRVSLCISFYSVVTFAHFLYFSKPLHRVQVPQLAIYKGVIRINTLKLAAWYTHCAVLKIAKRFEPAREYT